MLIVLVLLAILWIIAGVLLFIFTEASREVMKNVFKQKNLKTFSILPLAIGLLLILGAPRVSQTAAVLTLGLMGVAKGLFFMFGPKGKINAVLGWFLNAPDRLLRGWGIVSFLLGVMLLLII